MPTESDYRLPRTVVPRHYDITLEPDLDRASFEGTIVIDIEVLEPTTTIVLNAIELSLHSAKLSTDGRDLNGVVALDSDAERAVIAFVDTLPVGAATLTIPYTGILNDDLRGFYRSVYKNSDGEEVVIAATQFESTDARRAFPCWDEPDLKATFATTFIIDPDLTGVTNGGELRRSELASGKVRIEYATTMKMSTYLVAFIVGDFVSTDAVDVDGTPLRIIAPPGNEHLTDFAIEMGAHALRFFSDYYDIPYPGDKLDMVAIPDFAFGAMENLGCITYRETALLVDPDTATQSELSRVAQVIAHEIAHMWFGDLVTMKWWNGIWLNEAFASFAELKCVETFRPEWEEWLSFAEDRSRSQATDALAATRPIEFAVASPEEADAMFDVLTYEKGSSVLRMLENYLGEDVFRAGVTAYLKRHEYSNTDTPDLWAALEEVSGEPVGEIMDTWIFQGGYPRLKVEREGDTIRVSQEHFRLIGEGDLTWNVPVLYRSSAGEGKVVVGADPVTLEVGDDVIVNAGGEGFYRVAYDDETFASVVDRLPTLDPIERYSVIADAFASVVKGDADASAYLTLIAGLTDESEVEVWSVALAGVASLDRIISSDDRPALQSFVRSLVSETASDLGWTVGEGESDRKRKMRGLLLRSLGNLGADSETVEVARSVYDGDGPLDAEIADAALMIVAANDEGSRFDEFIEASKKASSPQQTVKMLRAATQVGSQETARRMFHMVLDGEIRTQDSFWVLALLLGHRDNGPMIWELIEEHWDAVMAVIPPVTRRRLLDLLPNRSEPDVASRIEAWFENHTIPGGEKATSQQLELMRAYVGLREREATRLRPILEQLSDA